MVPRNANNVDWVQRAQKTEDKKLAVWEYRVKPLLIHARVACLVFLNSPTPPSPHPLPSPHPSPNFGISRP